MDILKSSLRHKPLFISVYGTEDSSSDLSVLLPHSFLYICELPKITLKVYLVLTLSA